MEDVASGNRDQLKNKQASCDKLGLYDSSTTAESTGDMSIKMYHLQPFSSNMLRLKCKNDMMINLFGILVLILMMEPQCCKKRNAQSLEGVVPREKYLCSTHHTM